MLVLGREKGQAIYIGRGIRVTVLEVQRDGLVRIGVEAPQSVAVSRDDFTLAEHLRWQQKREAGAGVDRG